MPQRIGELLLARGLVRSGDIDAALDLQVVHGARLGSLLVELGRLDSKALGTVLSAQLNLPHATDELLAYTDPLALGRLSPEQAGRFQVLPMKLEATRVHVAMVAPQDLSRVEELQFVFGLRLVP